MHAIHRVKESVLRSAAAGMVGVALAASGAAQTSLQELASPDAQARENFGSAVAIEGDLLAIGVPQEGNWVQSAGAVHLYRRDAAGWSEEARLTPADGLAGDLFGAALAISGGRIAVGAPHHEAQGQHTGAVYVFRREAGEWIQEVKLLAFGATAGCRFGASVDLEGDRLVAGAPHQQSAHEHSGAAFVFRRAGSVWIFEQKLWHFSLTNWADYGASVSISGARIAVGAPKQQWASLASGLVHVLAHDGEAWKYEAVLSCSLPFYDSNFGRSLVLRGSELAIGSNAEAVFLFAHGDDGWSERQVLVTAENDEGVPLRFGHAVDFGGGALVVGSTLGDAQHVFAGAAYVFRHDGTHYVEDHKVQPPAPEAGAQFGYALAADGRRVLVGAPEESNGGQAESGAAYLLEVEFSAEEFCFGDGSQATCPCGNSGAPGHGCRNSVWTDGARLSKSGGSASCTGEGISFTVVHSLPLELGLFLRSASTVPGGAGAPFGDGLRCVGGQIERLGLALTGRAGDAVLHLAPPDPTRTAVGDSFVLQWWFRDPLPQVCGLGSNTSNGVLVTWQP